jgi:hypothetical protein
METRHTLEFEKDEVRAAVLRERELNEALCFLERAISRFATEECPSRWLSSRPQPRRRSLLARVLSPVVH